ncbi:hypothetical protein GW7_09250 [Heterocephalus glaber]|uniref:Uncharacterized protein n=1 Tax=Heterocephalus glaber TaxID=10181 RepID=G5ATG4_HETGA|nr:hypothetical protein GW7_09250 [Heterocephalus glaber]
MICIRVPASRFPVLLPNTRPGAPGLGAHVAFLPPFLLVPNGVQPVPPESSFCGGGSGGGGSKGIGRGPGSLLQPLLLPPLLTVPSGSSAS